MSDHLIECRWESQRCICDELRACEQRVYEWSKSFGVGKTFYDAGRLDALDAAETAVAEALKERMLMADCSPNTMRAPLLAIRALKEKE